MMELPLREPVWREPWTQECPAVRVSISTEPLGILEIQGEPYSLSVIKKGYSETDQDGNMRADGTITLIKGPQVIVVDTGSPWDRDLILQRLAEHGLQPTDVTHVVCTHGHSDHVGNLNLFPEATFLVSYDICRRDHYLSHDFGAGVPYLIDSWVEVIATPGHTGADTSVLVRGTAEGTVAVAGDLFECEGDEETWRELSENPVLQEGSRQKVLTMADVVIPGHGAPFRVIRTSSGPKPQ
ncbi:metallo-beta-lactamase domain-containing protein 1 [Rhinatrema bivittatum]|uniref:metallo-beta-lactamase domain-containing protein 1 n=1 Tax=Rhinatrema bivittatum TaxID=194408 RepID=UPI00112B0451|nr:metallo-beta-lactamase domain-containing protein 1 [Rhinatrema bivittatum]XP_029436491.1 metallo-beta-lactamase domain-containing protein 1 [Rhinatrema bivittatum]XP_029436492.1 metallo-beta-lactamase domain-containing protein 1 [Rhinatrema bivittatum]